MSITQTEFETILCDTTKRIDGDIRWREDEDHSPAVEFRVDVASDAGFPLVLVGWLNRRTDKLSYTLLHRGAGRVYGLCLGIDHHNPTCQNIGEKHKHRWTDKYRDKEAYVPGDITASVADPLAVWRQFCTEALLTHNGRMYSPPVPLQQQELPL